MEPRKPIPERVARLYPYQRRWVDDESRFKLAVKARQIGFTFAATLRAVLKRLEEPGLTVWLSASERQALEAMEQVRRHVTGLGVAARFYSELIADSSAQQHRVVFPNGGRIIALPANPDTVRGFSGNIILDEFAFHRDAGAIWRAAFATATRGFQLEVISTPNGTQGKFYELARQTGLVEAKATHVGVGQGLVPCHGKAPFDSALRLRSLRLGSGQAGQARGKPVPPTVWSAHWCDIYTARAQGFEVDSEALRAAVDDEDTWLQEYGCHFLSDAASYLPLELIAPAELPDARSPAPAARGSCYLGVDIGRKHDKTVLWLLEAEEGTPSRSGRVLWTRAVHALDRAPFSVQRAAIAELLSLRTTDGGAVPSSVLAGTGFSPYVSEPKNRWALAPEGRFWIHRCAIDATGIGAMLAEELQSRFGARVEPVQFTLAAKEDLALRVKRLLEERRLRIPYDAAIRRALAAIKRYSTPTGHFRFDAARTDEGHADEFWALALACSAAESTPLSTEFLPTQLPSAFRLAYAF